MPRRKVSVQDCTGRIVFEAMYDSQTEMLKGIEVLSDQAMYGADGYHIVIQMA